MIEFLQAIFETLLQATLALILGVFGFSWEPPEEEDEEEAITAMLSVPQISRIYKITTPVIHLPIVKNCEHDSDDASKLMDHTSRATEL